MKVYLANGLFTLGDRLVNELIAKRVREAIPDVDLYVPQENSDINDKSLYADSIMISRVDYAKLKDVDALIAVLDGNDNGVSVEVGAAFALGIPIFGLFTDVRQQGADNKQKIEALIKDPTENQFIYHNLMEIGCIKDSGGGLYSEIDDMVHGLFTFYEEWK